MILQLDPIQVGTESNDGAQMDLTSQVVPLMEDQFDFLAPSIALSSKTCFNQDILNYVSNGESKAVYYPASFLAGRNVIE